MSHSLHVFINAKKTGQVFRPQLFGSFVRSKRASSERHSPYFSFTDRPPKVDGKYSFDAHFLKVYAMFV